LRVAPGRRVRRDHRRGDVQGKGTHRERVLQTLSGAATRGRNGAPAGPPNTSASPHGLALNSDGTKLYIGTENADISGVIVYDVKAAKVLKKIDLLLATIKIGRGPGFPLFSPDSTKLYVMEPTR